MSLTAISMWHIVSGVADADAVAAIQAWTRLDQALTAFNRELERTHGVTGAQLAVLRLITEWGPAVRLADMRSRLVMHPATLGQLLDRLAARGLVDLTEDESDRRCRVVRVTGPGRKIIASAPLAGPVRLRHVAQDPARLRRLARALTDAVELFGLGEYVA
jgi:MarR family transcriptional regulator, temperature-dependent positive regulator of motility